MIAPPVGREPDVDRLRLWWGPPGSLRRLAGVLLVWTLLVSAAALPGLLASARMVFEIGAVLIVGGWMVAFAWWRLLVGAALWTSWLVLQLAQRLAVVLAVPLMILLLALLLILRSLLWASWIWAETGRNPMPAAWRWSYRRTRSFGERMAALVTLLPARAVLAMDRPRVAMVAPRCGSLAALRHWRRRQRPVVELVRQRLRARLCAEASGGVGYAWTPPIAIETEAGAQLLRRLLGVDLVVWGEEAGGGERRWVQLAGAPARGELGSEPAGFRIQSGRVRDELTVLTTAGLRACAGRRSRWLLPRPAPPRARSWGARMRDRLLRPARLIRLVPAIGSALDAGGGAERALAGVALELLGSMTPRDTMKSIPDADQWLLEESLAWSRRQRRRPGADELLADRLAELCEGRRPGVRSDHPAVKRKRHRAR